MQATICNDCKKQLDGNGAELIDGSFSKDLDVKINGRDGSGSEMLKVKLSVAAHDRDKRDARVDLCNECFRGLLKKIIGGM